MQKCNKQILKALDLWRWLIILADVGEGDAKDDSCILLYSVIRDCAYKIRKQAEAEMENHKTRGVWK